ncbi:MAG: hypothetical protein ACOX21_09185 [Bacillota bacterium]|nr:hypothetical protein [Bacillota bacterium]HPZ21470.1 hypothetical protein [Bacillota bacterium]HQD19332.1 hypothetical protein [Bacillota bacterium]
MRRGYWTGFFTGGLIGMLAVKAFGDQLLDLMYSKLTQHTGGTPSGEEGEAVYRPRQRYRSRRTW